MKKKLLYAGVLLGLAIAMVPFGYFIYCVLSENLRFSEILGHGKYVVPMLLGGGILMVLCIHMMSGKKPINENEERG